jgi:hypothetical protein
MQNCKCHTCLHCRIAQYLVVQNRFPSTLHNIYFLMRAKLGVSHQGNKIVWEPWNVTFLPCTYFISYKFKPNTYTAVGNAQLTLISLLNISAHTATLKGVRKIQVEVREVYWRGCMRVVRMLTETLSKKNLMHFQKLSTIFYFEQGLLKFNV